MIAFNLIHSVRKTFLTILIFITVGFSFSVFSAGNSGKKAPEASPDFMTGLVEDNKTFKLGNMEVKASAQKIIIAVGGKTIFELPALMEADVDESTDIDLFDPAFTIEKNRCVWTVKSSNWEKKEYSLSMDGTAVVLRIKVQGKGKLAKIRYFNNGKKPGQQLEFEVLKYMLPVALGGPKAVPQWRNTMESASIDLGYMTPPLLAFPFTGNFSGSFAIGLAPRTGNYNMDHFRCEFAMYQDGLFSTDFNGYTEVNGEYELPALIFTLGNDEFDALTSYSEWFYQFGGCTKIDRSDIPQWWLGPFFCGWGEQEYLSPENRYAGANQKHYSIMSERLDELYLKPTVIIIDDKWQGQFGELLPDPAKWPELRKFVDAEHAKGRRVLLWMKAWDNEGLRANESVKSLLTPYGADPTSPFYRQRIKETMHKLLSSDPGCFNCDGFKIDFANCMPLGKNLRTHEPGVYGIELLKRLMSLIYESAKAVKPDCLINTSCSHPYFAEVTDQCRLHDYNGQLRYIWEVREYRAKLFKIAFPGISIDTDDPSCSSKEQVKNYLQKAPELGVPVLYRLHGSRNFPLTEEDFKWVSKIWAEYSKNIKNH